MLSQRDVFFCDPRADDGRFQGAGFVTVRSVREAVELSKVRPFKIRLETKSPLAFEGLCWLAWERRDCTLAVDEVHELVSGQHACIPPVVTRLLLEGRHRNVRFYAASQRPANVHNNILSEASCGRIHVFQIGFDSVKYCEKWIPNVARAMQFRNPGEHFTFPEVNSGNDPKQQTGRSDFRNSVRRGTETNRKVA